MIEMSFRARTPGELVGDGKLYRDVMDLTGVRAGDVFALSFGGTAAAFLTFARTPADAD